MHQSKLFVGLLCLFISACGTVRMNYEAEVKTPDQTKSSIYSLKKSYEIGGPHKILCMLTGILYGGYCWYYISMPTDDQTARIEKDAKTHLNKLYGSGNYSMKRTNVEVDAWSEGPEQSMMLKPGETPPSEIEEYEEE